MCTAFVALLRSFQSLLGFIKIKDALEKAGIQIFQSLLGFIARLPSLQQGLGIETFNPFWDLSKLL